MKAIALPLLLSISANSANTQQLDDDFTISEDDQAAGCAESIVAGLDPNGDGLLAMRSDPEVDYSKIDELRNGDMMRTYAQMGNGWVFIRVGPTKRAGHTASGCWTGPDSASRAAS